MTTNSTTAQERVAMISGANRGIGAAIARHLAGQGWRLSLGMRNPQTPDGLDALRFHVVAYDAKDPQAEARWVAEALEKFGRIAAVIANAGIIVRKNVIEADDADLDAMLAVNVKAPRRMAAAAWNALG